MLQIFLILFQILLRTACLRSPENHIRDTVWLVLRNRYSWPHITPRNSFPRNYRGSGSRVDRCGVLSLRNVLVDIRLLNMWLSIPIFEKCNSLLFAHNTAWLGCLRFDVCRLGSSLNLNIDLWVIVNQLVIDIVKVIDILWKLFLITCHIFMWESSHMLIKVLWLRQSCLWALNVIVNRLLYFESVLRWHVPSLKLIVLPR